MKSCFKNVGFLAISVLYFSCVQRAENNAQTQEESVVVEPTQYEDNPDFKPVDTFDVEETDTIDYGDEAEAYVPPADLPDPSSVRMKELMRFHVRNNGKLKRAKIARILNREGYTKGNGERFTRRDIPIYPN
ncbi:MULTISPECIES: hypothetical protein [unclassified Flavobacterium]|uniref:hypothetical protein n=1 Tax=unclassified Flavobacterium TaxID=196869 RepID=UPI001F12EA9E|nr:MULTISPECIES: hypothetical protein [unclassified Flavobacterium]UMY64896.1 hypothetical protein MKO97_10265 [Flavobacterium sp. HJ-32-4]